MAQSYKGPLDYIDVATRIVEFREKFPQGSLQQVSYEFVNVNGKDWIIYTAAAYRSPDDDLVSEQLGNQSQGLQTLQEIAKSRTQKQRLGVARWWLLWLLIPNRALLALRKFATDKSKAQQQLKIGQQWQTH